MKLRLNPFDAGVSVVAPAISMTKEGSSALDMVRLQERMATLLALVSGYVDAYAYLNYKTYASFMSVNTTQTSLQDESRLCNRNFKQSGSVSCPRA